MVAILIVSAKLATPDRLKIKEIWNKDYDVRSFVHDVTNKIFLLESNYAKQAVIWAKFGNSSISMRVVITTSILKGFDQKNLFFGLALIMVLKFYTSVAKGLKLKARKCWGLIPTIVEVAGEKLEEVAFLPYPHTE